MLIANRGEIACRIIRSCKKLGILTVAVYSDADRDALHVKLADEAYRIGPAASDRSYLRGDKIIRIAKKTKADAIHPGYGFLSEDPKFAEATRSAEIEFIGPRTDVIAQMGNKVAARHAAQNANVPIIPGTEQEIDDSQAITVGRSVGYPLMVKATDGGGGMGIRLVEVEEDLLKSIDQARTQAQTAFGSSGVYLERRVSPASHIEVQIIADNHGTVLHLFDRDCSIQRRSQKVIEETPSPKLSAGLRRRICLAAVRLMRNIGYSNAGTVEFLLDQNGDFFFLEVNSRLQVEHPITEMVTGVDLVELQLRCAAGEHLNLKQGDISRSGHSIEARIYPEDPETMLPTAGSITKVTEPSTEDTRVDGAIFQGYDILSYYESMMSKLIVWGKDRPSAIELMRRALLGYTIEGVSTNIPMISRVLAHAKFVDGDYGTNSLEEILEDTGTSSAGNELIAVVALATALMQDQAAKTKPSRWKQHARRMAMVTRLSTGGV